MKTLISMSFALILFSPLTLAAQSSAQTLQEVQQACKLKQVTHSCEVASNEKSFKGICVDAKEYGLICSKYKFK